MRLCSLRASITQTPVCCTKQKKNEFTAICGNYVIKSDVAATAMPSLWMKLPCDVKRVTLVYWQRGDLRIQRENASVMSTNEQRTKRALFVVMCHLYWKEYGRNTVVTAGKSMHSFQTESIPSRVMKRGQENTRSPSASLGTTSSSVSLGKSVPSLLPIWVTSQNQLARIVPFMKDKRFMTELNGGQLRQV